MKKFLFLIALFTLMGGANSVKADALIVKTPVILTGGKAGCNPGPCTYGIQMQGWQQFIAYEDATGVSFDEDSYMQFDLEETCANTEVRVTFRFDDGTELEDRWWCLGIGESADDKSTPYYHVFDESKYWLKKGLGEDFEEKKSLKITKVVVKNFNYDSGNSVVTYKVNGGTICGAPMTIKNDNTKTFGFLSGTFSPTAQQQNIFIMQNFEVGDYQKLVIEFGEAIPSRWAVYTGVLSDLQKDITKKEITLNGANLPEFTLFNWDGPAEPIKIKEVYLYKEVSEIVATEIYEAPAGTTDINDVAGTYTELKINYPKVISGEAATLCGDGDGGAENKNADISDYDYLCFEITEVSGGTSDLRVWVWNGEKVVTLRPHPVADYADVKDWTADYSISTAGTYAVKVADYNKLKGAKTNWGSSATLTVSEAYLGKGTPVEYVPSGKYHLSGFSGTSASLEAALEDPNATFYDASGVLGTDVELTATNKNALFKANAGVLANTKNVIVDGTCDNLELTDGYPFKAPYNFTATEASYSTTINAEAGAGTLCLPFAAAIPGGVTAYTLTYTSGDKAAATPVETTIQANTPVLLNGSGAVEFTGSGAVSASAANESGALTGVFEATTVPENSYVLQKGASGLGFYKVESGDIVANPFRAYLTAKVLGARTIGITYGGVTNINEVKANKVGEKDVYYNLNGQRVSNPTKGVFIKNGVKVSF